MANRVDALIGTVIDGRYRVDEFVARGGMATVFKATDLRLQRTVALKVMHSSLAEDEGFVARFVREARSAANLNDPSIVSVYDQGEADGTVYLAMEYVAGETLRDRIARSGRLSARDSLAICESVLEALGAAHQAGIVHRDIKPENVLIAPDGRVKVADFGLARAIVTSEHSGITQGLLIGTVAYLAPEQVERGTADPRTDVYATGILLYECVVGQTPFTGETPMAIAYQHVHSQVPIPSSIRGDIPPEIDELVAIATAQAPESRYADASDFANHLRTVRVELVDVPAPLAEGHHTVVLNRDNHTLSTSHATTDPAAVGTAAAAAGVLADTATLATAPPGHVGPAAGPWVSTESSSSTSQPPDPPSQDQNTPHSRPYRLRILVALVVLAVLAGVSAVGAWAWTQSQLTKMPDVVGMTQAKAAETLAAEDLGIRVVGRDFSSSVPKGRILSTDPSAGGDIRSGSEVLARTSAGPQMVSVPKLAGLSQSSATAALREAGLKPSAKTQFSESVAEGTVISSAPGAGKSIPIDSRVTMIVSKGPPPVTVPNVTGMDESTAVTVLEAAGLRVVVANQLPVVVLSRVYSQDPAPGSVVDKGATVTITLV